MKVNEILNEISNTPREIRKELLAQGYTFLGKGVDQSTYSHPNSPNSVLKIFGSGNLNPHEFSKSQLMFKYWTEYCKEHSSNQFLPKFLGWESFELKGNKYLQIKMEKLKPLPLQLSGMLHELANLVSARIEISNILKYTEVDNDTLYGAMTEKEINELKKLIILLGIEQFTLFYNTLEELCHISRKKNWIYDLHGRNFMHRNDGIPVIVDPWAL